MPTYGVPDTCTELLKNFNFSDFNRSRRQEGNYYYSHKTYPELKIIYNTKKNVILFKRELKRPKRADSISYSLKNNTVSLHYIEAPAHINTLFSTYDFSTDEGEIFMQSTVQNKYYPKLEDFLKIKRLQTAFKQDIIDWNDTMEKRKRERLKASLKKYPFLKHHFK